MDYSLFHFVNQFAGRNGPVDAFFTFIASYGPVFFILPLLWIWFRGDDDSKRAALLALLTMAVAMLIGSLVIGHLFFRDRPFVDHQVNQLISHGRDTSFPSDHATFSFAIAWIILFKNRIVGVLSVAMAVLVAFSRVFVGVHYPGDVIGGAILGLVVAVIVWSLRNQLQPLTQFLVGVARKVKLA